MIKNIKHLLKLFYSLIMLTRHGIFDYYPKKNSLLWIWMILCGWHKNHKPLAEALIELGPFYIKIGQFLATRGDIFPQKLCDDLSKLQDKVPSFDSYEAAHILETDLSCKVRDILSEFSPPIAAASVAQVHYGYLQENGDKVAVKILRPKIRETFRHDIETFKLGGKIINFLTPKLRRLKLLEVLKIFEDSVAEELDLRLEAASLSHYTELSREQNHSNLILPHVYWDYTTENILITSFLEGSALTDKRTLQKEKHNYSVVAQNLMEIFLKDVTNTGYFHGDLHQGNIFITEDDKIALFDFGIMGYLDEKSRWYLAKILYGFVKRDYYEIAQLHFKAGYVPAHHKIEKFAQSLRSIGEPIFGKKSKDFSMGRVLASLFSVTEQYDMETRPELVLLQKNMVSLEGVCKTLDPTIDIWTVSRPILEKWVKDNSSIHFYTQKIYHLLKEKLESI